MQAELTSVQVVLIIVSFLAAIVGFLASLVSVLILSRMGKLEKNQDEMKKDWMGKNETNYMVKRVEDKFDGKHDQLSESLDNMAVEWQTALNSAVSQIAKNVSDCSLNILRQVSIAIKSAHGDKIGVDDVLGTKHDMS
jgi:predicted PurR-regulated permease PerM